MMMATQQDILAALDQRRRELGLSVANLAHHAGLGTATVQRALRGKGTDSISTILAIAHAMGTRLDLRPSTIGAVRRKQAERKADALVRLMRGNAALENRFVDAGEVAQLKRETVKSLEAGSNYALWA